MTCSICGSSVDHGSPFECVRQLQERLAVVTDRFGTLLAALDQGFFQLEMEKHEEPRKSVVELLDGWPWQTPKS